MEQQARQWISVVAGEPFPAGTFQAALKSGVLLCKVANKLKPNAVPKVNMAGMAFMQVRAPGRTLAGASPLDGLPSTPWPNADAVAGATSPHTQMENINNFLNFCYSIGVVKTDSFQTIDLFEAQNMTQVVIGIHALSRAAAAKGLTTHVIGPKLAEANPRNFTEEQLNAGKYVPSQQLGNNLGASQAGMTYGRRREIDESHNIH